MENETTSPEVSLDTWAIVELFGHTRIAGKISNVSIAGCGFIRVQVPAHKNVPAYTRDIAPKAIYALNPCDEAAVMSALGHCSESPVVELCASDIYKRIREEMKTRETTPQLDYSEDDDENEDEDDFDGQP